MKHEFKGTPGPWANEGGDNYAIDIILPNDSTISLSRYSRYYTGLSMDRDEMIANASVIAAAPDLLEALQELVHLHGCEQEAMASGKPTLAQWMEALDKANNAIAKALNLNQ